MVRSHSDLRLLNRADNPGPKEPSSQRLHLAVAAFIWTRDDLSAGLHLSSIIQLLCGIPFRRVPPIVFGGRHHSNPAPLRL